MRYKLGKHKQTIHVFGSLGTIECKWLKNSIINTTYIKDQIINFMYCEWNYKNTGIYVHDW